MDLGFSRFYTLLSLLVVVRLYGFSSLFAAAKSLEFRRLRLKENPDIMVGLVVSLSKLSTKLPQKRARSIVQGDSW